MTQCLTVGGRPGSAGVAVRKETYEDREMVSWQAVLKKYKNYNSKKLKYNINIALLQTTNLEQFD